MGRYYQEIGVERRVSWKRGIRILAVGPLEEEKSYLRSICTGAGWTLLEVNTLTDALACLDKKSCQVVLCERDSPEGGWTALLDAVRGLPAPPPLIVWSRNADCFLWAEVLNLGGFDVLASPFRVKEVVHAVGMALRSWWGGQEYDSKIRQLAPAQSSVRGGGQSAA